MMGYPFPTALLSILIVLCAPVPCYAQWFDFAWAAHTWPDGIVLPKAAILLPVTLNGVHCTMQLDTGADTSSLYRNALPKPLAAAQPLNQLEKIEIHGFEIGAEVSTRTFPLMYPASAAEPPASCDGVAGTIGNDFLRGSSLTLDLPLARFRIQRGGGHADSRGLARHVVPMTLLDTGHGGVVPVLDAHLKDGTAIKLMLDTGSAPAGIIVFLERRWLKLVGLDTLQQAHSFSTVRWGRPITCYTARLTQALALGDMTIAEGESAMHCADPAEPAQEQNKLFGLIGLAPFLDSRITLDYVSQQLVVTPSRRE